MDFVDKQYVVRIKVGQKGGEVAGAFEDGAAGLAQIYAQLFGDDVGKGGFAQSGRAEKQDVVECFAAFFGGLDEDGELLFGFMLPDVVVQRFGAEGAFEQFFLCGGGLGATMRCGCAAVRLSVCSIVFPLSGMPSERSAAFQTALKR